MWNLLRGRQIAGAKFRRQHPLEPYILDFYCHELKLAIELDGGQHNEPAGRAHDQQRDGFVANQGIRTFRFWNNQVLAETEAVLEAVYQAVVESQAAGPSSNGPSPIPLPEGEGKESDHSFVPLPEGEGKGEGGYSDFTPVVTERRALAELVKSNPGVAKAHARFVEELELWWKEHLPLVEALAPKNGKRGNVYELRRQLLVSITAAFAKQHLLNEHQIRGALASYFEFFKPEFKSIAFSGWGPELIPDDDVLQSQFPQILADMEQKHLRLAELSSLFAAADEEDYEDSDDSGVLPDNEVKALRAELKEAKAQAKLAKKEKGDQSEFLVRAEAAEKRLARHKGLEDEERQLKADLRATEKKKEELVAAAREKIDRDEARRVILDRLHRLLIQTYEGYLRADQRACTAALENLHAKYAVTAKAIETKRDSQAAKLKAFLSELGYE
jgi:type I restriction enzyme M protein